MSLGERNLATDNDAVAAYDEPGSWGRLSEGWPETPYSIGKLLLCTKAEVVPYGQYVVVGNEYTYPHKRQPDGSWYDYSKAVIRVANEALKKKLEAAYHGMFVECGHMIASVIEARSAETTQIGSAEGESAVGNAETPKDSRPNPSVQS